MDHRPMEERVLLIQGQRPAVPADRSSIAMAR